MNLHNVKLNYLKNKAEKAKKEAEKREERHMKEMELAKLKEEIKVYNSKHNKGLEHREKIGNFISGVVNKVMDYNSKAPEREKAKIEKLGRQLQMEKKKTEIQKAKTKIEKTKMDLRKEKKGLPSGGLDMSSMQSFFGVPEKGKKRTPNSKPKPDLFEEKAAKEWGLT